MADSMYRILEYRLVDKTGPDGVDNVMAYICISDPTDFLPIGGWRGCKVPKDVDSISFLTHAFQTQEYLIKWERIAPDDINQQMADRFTSMERQLEELSRQLAAASMSMGIRH